VFALLHIEVFEQFALLIVTLFAQSAGHWLFEVTNVEALGLVTGFQVFFSLVAAQESSQNFDYLRRVLSQCFQ
jgi:hypothetical protein